MKVGGMTLSSSSSSSPLPGGGGRGASSSALGTTGTSTSTTATDMSSGGGGGGCCLFGGGLNNNNTRNHHHHPSSFFPLSPNPTITTKSPSSSSSYLRSTITSTTTTTTTTLTTATTTTTPSNSSSSSSSSDHLTDDAELVKELNELSVKERERVYDDIHGCTEGLQIESTEFIKSKLISLKKAIDELPRTKRPALDRAFFLKPSIESDTKFMLMFLRAVNYDTIKASKRMAKYFTDKLKLFGEMKLVKKITPEEDFTSDDMELFLKGPCIDHPEKYDNVGRPIWLSNVSAFDFSRPKSLNRVSWYMIMQSLEDEAAQLKGVCNVILCPKEFKFPPGSSPRNIYGMMIDSGDMLANLPVRISASHFCYAHPGLEFMLRAFRGAFGKHQRLRMRAHFGSKVEIQYSLLTYGISCPFISNNDDDDGTTVNDNNNKNYELHMIHQTNVKERLQKETAESSKRLKREEETGVIIYPKPNDVLVGRGCPYQTYSGNVKLSNIVETKFLDKYCQVIDRFEKTCIHMDVVKYIQTEVGGRFLERSTTKGGWIVVDDKVARKKVNSSFRSKLAKKVNTTTNNAKNNTTTTDQGTAMAKAKNKTGFTNNDHPLNNVTTTLAASSSSIIVDGNNNNNTKLLFNSLFSSPSSFDGLGLSSSSDNNLDSHHNNDNNNRNSTMKFSFFSNGGGGGGGGGGEGRHNEYVGGNNNANKRLRYDPSLLT